MLMPIVSRLRQAGSAACLAALAACATASDRESIYDGLLRLGLSEGAANCLVKELDQRLDAQDLGKVAGIVNAAREQEGFFAAVRDAGEADIASAFAAASFACTFGD